MTNFCYFCGSPLKDTDLSCPACGARESRMKLIMKLIEKEAKTRAGKITITGLYSVSMEITKRIMGIMEKI